MARAVLGLRTREGWSLHCVVCRQTLEFSCLSSSTFFRPLLMLSTKNRNPPPLITTGLEQRSTLSFWSSKSSDYSSCRVGASCLLLVCLYHSQNSNCGDPAHHLVEKQGGWSTCFSYLSAKEKHYLQFQSQNCLLKSGYPHRWLFHHPSSRLLRHCYPDSPDLDPGHWSHYKRALRLLVTKI